MNDDAWCADFTVQLMLRSRIGMGDAIAVARRLASQLGDLTGAEAAHAAIDRRLVRSDDRIAEVLHLRPEGRRYQGAERRA